MADFVLETERLGLRRIGAGDAALQFETLNSAAVMRHLGGPKALADIEAKHAKIITGFERDGYGFMFLIEKQTGNLVGHCGLKRVDSPLAPNPGDFEIGWLIREDRWRRGYAIEAMRAVINWAFGEIGAPFVVALTSPANTGSWKLMEKLGMERREDLDFEDPAYPPEDNPTIQYSLTQEQWEQQQ